MVLAFKNQYIKSQNPFEKPNSNINDKNNKTLETPVQDMLLSFKISAKKLTLRALYNISFRL